MDDALNHHCRDFFRGTMAALERAYVRPRYDGYISFQDKGGILLYEFLQKEDDARRLIDELQQLYEQRGE
jgi:multiple sugar transport system substrate-binding protein